MAFEEFRVQIAMLMEEISGNPDDPHQLQERLRETLAEMQSLGLPLPADLVRLEDYLEREEAVEPEPEPETDPEAPDPKPRA